jgi:hypothetical protein
MHTERALIVIMTSDCHLYIMTMVNGHIAQHEHNVSIDHTRRFIDLCAMSMEDTCDVEIVYACCDEDTFGVADDVTYLTHVHVDCSDGVTVDSKQCKCGGNEYRTASATMCR